jgi:hypothetical protein
MIGDPQGTQADLKQVKFQNCFKRVKAGELPLNLIFYNEKGFRFR